MAKESESNERIEVTIDVFLEDIIPGYMENRRRDIVRILTLLDQKNFEEIRFLGHSMKGSGGGYGFIEISVIGANIEEGSKEEDLGIIKKNVDRLVHFLDHVKIIYK